MIRIPYHIVDVFTDRPFGGNQLAVIPNGRGLSTQMMQSIAREFNFSETSFVLPPEDPTNDYKVRIFTPTYEMPIAGHPTVGTAFVLARERMIHFSGSEANIIFEEGVGPVPVKITFKGGAPDLIYMTQPLPKFGARFTDAGAIAGLLSLEPESIDTRFPMEVVSCGAPFLYVPLKNLAAMRRIRLRPDAWDSVLGEFETSNLFVFTQEVENSGSTVHSRMFAPGLGIAEDPATGGASGPLGGYLVHHGLVKGSGTIKMVSEQGIEMGRPSFIGIEIDQENGQVTGARISGRCCYIADGSLELSSLESV